MVPSFCEQFSPSDARFLGAPIDYVIFDGLHRGVVDRVVFLEIKSGKKPALNKNEREIRRAIAEKRVEFQVMWLPPSPMTAASPSAVDPRRENGGSASRSRSPARRATPPRNPGRGIPPPPA